MKKLIKYLVIICFVFFSACSTNETNPPNSNNTSTMSINSIYSMSIGNWRLDSVKTFSNTNGNSTDYQFVGSTINLTSVIAYHFDSNCSSNYFNSILNEKYSGIFQAPYQDIWFIEDGNCSSNTWPNSYRYLIRMGSIMNGYSTGHIESISSNQLVLVSSSVPLLLPQITNGWRAYWSKN